MARLTSTASQLTPSALSRKIVCPAYIPAPLDDASRLRFLGMHALVVVQVISRHLSKGYQLKGVERNGNGFRVDLLFQDRNGKFRLSEVKTSRILRESHKLQAALYSAPIREEFEEVEIVVSNRTMDELLSPAYIEEALRRADDTKRFLESSPEVAAITYRPNNDCCYICNNRTCPFLELARPPPSESASPEIGSGKS